MADVPGVVVEARGLTKVFQATIALGGVDLGLVAGRVHALIGENGAGKSTLARILAGVERPTSGELWMDGQPVHFASAREARARGIDIIHQELPLFPALSVAENMFVGRERVARSGLIDRQAQEAAASQAVARLNQVISPRALVGTLRLGQQQIVAIGRALVHDTRVLLMDEPTSALTASEIPVLFQVIRELTTHGVAVVYISHRLEELLAIADTVTVLRDGRLAGHEAAREIDVAWIVDRMTGGARARTSVATAEPRGRVLLSVEDLCLVPQPGRSPVEGVSFEVHAGEVVGIYGLMGAGRTELLESLMGLHPDASGAVILDGRPIQRRDIGDRVDAGLAMVPEDRQAAGLVNTMSVRDNLTLSSLSGLARWGYLSAAAEARAAADIVRALRVKAANLGASIEDLSGGNQQKVVMGRGLMRRPRVLLVDEPTRGVDVAAKAEILDAMRRLAADGLGVVFCSSDLGEIRAAATTVLVMARGRITARYEAADATDAALASAASASVLGGLDATA